MLLTMVALFVESSSVGIAFGSPIELRKVKAAAIKQLPKKSANAEVTGMAELSGLMRRRHAKSVLTYPKYSRIVTCIITATIYDPIKGRVIAKFFIQKRNITI